MTGCPGTVNRFSAVEIREGIRGHILIVEKDRGAGTQENRGGRWAGSGRRRSGMRESCEGGRREKNESY